MIRLQSNYRSLIETVLLLFLLTPVILCGAHAEYIFESDTSVTVITFPHNNIFKGSVIFHTTDSSRISEVIERVDYKNGTIYLNKKIFFDAPIPIGYQYLSYELPDYYSLRKLGVQDSSVTIKSETNLDFVSPQKYAQTNSTIKIKGFKTMRVSAGNAQDFDLDQTLSLQIQGEPVNGLIIAGSLSDQARPEVGGISSSLEEIESVSLLAKSKNFEMKLGDLAYSNNWGGLTSFNKRLKGMDSDFSFGKFTGRMVVSGLKGRFYSISFSGRDGVSGPYSLEKPSGARTSIISRTEKVYIDGQLLRNGASEDYVIDYSRGEITFNPGINITSRSRITIDYEYLEQSYRRNLYSSQLAWDSDKSAFQIDIGYLELSDSRNNPVDISLSDQDIQILSSAGDSQKSAVSDGAEYVGDSMGNYIVKTAETDDIFYEFVGDSLGDYNVRFSRVILGDGDYSYLGNSIYKYEGRGKGNYLPFEYLPLPSKQRAVYLKGKKQFSEILNIDFTLSGSDSDRNLFSELDDNNNAGFLSEFNLNFQPGSKSTQENNGFRSVTDLKLKIREEQYSLPGRKEIVEYDRYWALDSDTIYKRADHLEIKQMLAYKKTFSLNGEWGGYRDSDIISASRNGLSATLQPYKYLSFTAVRSDRLSQNDLTQSDGRIYSNKVTGEYNFKKLIISGGLQNEKDLRQNIADSLTGFKYYRYYSDIKYDFIKFGFSRRIESRFEQVWIDNYSDYVFSSRISKAFYKNRYRLDAEIVRRTVEYEDSSTPDFTETGALSNLSFSTLKNILTGKLSYRLSRQLVSHLATNFIRVEDGLGDYRLEDSVYVTDEYGDYVAVDELIENGEAGLTSERNLRLNVDLLRIFSTIKGISRFNSETRLSVEERGGNSYRLNLLYLFPFWQVYPEMGLYYQYELRQTLTLGFSSGDFISVGFEESRVSDELRDRITDKYRRIFYEKLFLLINQAFNVQIEHRFKKERENSGYFGNADFIEHDIRADLIFYYGRILELHIEPRYLIDESKGDDLKINMLGGKIKPVISVSERGRFTGEFSYFKVNEQNNRDIPYQYAAGNRAGDNYKWAATFNYKYSKMISGQFQYSADKIPGLKTRHRVSMNMKAVF